MKKLCLVLSCVFVATFGYAQGPSVTTIGFGCPTFNSMIPVLSTNQVPYLGNLNFSLTVSNVQPGTPIFLFGSIGTTNFPMNIGGNCNVYLDPVSMLTLMDLGLSPMGPLGANPFGLGTFAMPIPPMPSLSGLTLGFQAAVVGPYSPLGVGLSNALEVHFE